MQELTSTERLPRRVPATGRSAITVHYIKHNVEGYVEPRGYTQLQLRGISKPRNTVLAPTPAEELPLGKSRGASLCPGDAVGEQGRAVRSERFTTD